MQLFSSSFPKKKKKRTWVEDVKDFKPINLVGSLYKLFVEVLANKLKRLKERCCLRYKKFLLREDKS